MPQIEETITIERDPDTVWGVVGDLGAICDWLPVLAESSVSDGVRSCELEGGGSLVEKIHARDDATRSYTYEITDSPWPIERHTATMTVAEQGSGSLVTWTTDVEPPDLTDAFAGVLAQGVAALKAQLEA